MDPSDPIAAVTHPDPYPYYARLARNMPITYDAGHDIWVAASADAVRAVLSSPACRVRPADEPIPRALLGSASGAIFGALVRMNDGAGHAALKGAIAATLIPNGVAEASQHWAHQLAHEPQPQHHRRQLTALMFRLPAYVIADLLGVTHDQLAPVAGLVHDLVAGLSPIGTAEQAARGAQAAERLCNIIERLLAGQPDGANAGLLLALARAARRAGYADAAIVANAIGLLTQSYEATAGLIGNTLVALATRPELASQVRDDAELCSRVVREVLRYDPPIQNTRRFVAEDMVIAGLPMRAGATVLVVLAAANRDPLVFSAPNRFEPLRDEQTCFTFGVGAHACPGASLAITIAAAGVAALLGAGAPIEHLADGVEYHPSLNARIPRWEEADR